MSKKMMSPMIVRNKIHIDIIATTRKKTKDQNLVTSKFKRVTQRKFIDYNSR